MQIYKSLKLVALVLFIAIAAFFAGCGGGISPPITPNTYIITSSAGPHGSISPFGNVTVNQGSDKSFTITPDTGYSIDDVLVDGSSVGAVSSYTFTNVTQDHTISATFSVAPGPVHNLTKDTYYNTIQAALDDADNDNIIEVADGTYDESITFPSVKKIILQSVNGASLTTIREIYDSPTVTIDGSLTGTTLKGFTITHADRKTGKGIYFTGGKLYIINCIISNNSGTGIYNRGTLTITNSTIFGNSGFVGGGIYNSYGTLTITDSTIFGNSSDFSGGGINNYGPLSITGSTISDNSAFFDGGGIVNHDTLNITGSSIYDNDAGLHGGGISNGGTLTITDSNISGNSCFVGGGIDNGGSLSITGSTISDNSASDRGGGIYISWPTGTITIGGSGVENTICGNYKSAYNPSLDQQIRDSSGSLYDTYKNTNYISAYCE